MDAGKKARCIKYIKMVPTISLVINNIKISAAINIMEKNIKLDINIFI